jgi:hypothetical protein
MPYPRSQLTRLYDGIRSAPSMAAQGLSVALGRRHMSRNAGPQKVTIFPVEGQLSDPRKNREAIKDVDRVVYAHLWGQDFDALEDLQNRFFQALEWQSSPEPSNPAPTKPIGLFWRAEKEQWVTTFDSATQGEELFVILSVVCSIDRVPATTGSVDSTQLNGTITQGA